MRVIGFSAVLVALPAQAAVGQGRAAFNAPRTPWGDPDLQGYYTNSDESLIPMERPDTLTGKSLTRDFARGARASDRAAQRGPHRG